MSVLFINACMREGSRTLRICREYISRNVKDDVTELRLWEADIAPITAESLALRDERIAQGTQREHYSLSCQFAEADEIIMAAPYWDCGFPSILKVYIENISVSGITLEYEGGFPKKLCQGKRLTYITTAGGYLPENSSVEIFGRELCEMFGIPEYRFIFADGLDIWENDPEKILSDTISEF